MWQAVSEMLITMLCWLGGQKTSEGTNHGDAGLDVDHQAHNRNRASPGAAGGQGEAGIDDSIHTLLSQQSLWEHRQTWLEAEKCDRYRVQHLTHSDFQLERVGSKAGPSFGNQLSGEDMSLRVLKGTTVH